MSEAQRELLINYLKSNVVPILVDFIDAKSIPNCVVLPASLKINEFNGQYNNIDFNPPEWLNKLENASTAILVIDLIDSINKEEQIKFKEILKYKKISTFKLPENTIIIVTAKEINESTINEEIYSLVAHLKG